MSYVLNGIEAPTLDALELALARRELGAAAPSPIEQAKKFLQALLSSRRTLVRKLLKKYGTMPRGIAQQKGPSIKAPWGTTYDFSTNFVDKASDEQLAGLLLVAAAVDQVHLANAALQSALSGLGEDAPSIDPATITAIIDIVVKVGPGIASFVGSLMQPKAPPKAPTSALAKPLKAASAAQPVRVDLGPVTPAAPKSNMPLILLGLGALALGAWFFLRKK